MRLLLDHCVPRRLRKLLPGHDVKTAFEMGWAGLENGALLAQAASRQFELFVTVDQNVQYQQNLSLLPLSVLVLIARDNRFETLSRFAPFVIALLQSPPTTPSMILLKEDGSSQVLTAIPKPKP